MRTLVLAPNRGSISATRSKSAQYKRSRATPTFAAGEDLDGRLIRSEPKTAKSRRVIYLPDLALEALRALKGSRDVYSQPYEWALYDNAANLWKAAWDEHRARGHFPNQFESGACLGFHDLAYGATNDVVRNWGYQAYRLHCNTHALYPGS